MIVGLGIDNISIARIERAIAREHFLSRVFTEGERARIEKKGAQTAAGYFAAKEAAAKALGTGFRGFMPWHVEVIVDDLGRPGLAFHAGALARFEAVARSAHLSISHADGFACAVCILEI